ncbi:hypothetical protein EI77_03224 [Prosthecobacter fusiformis]|uniref:Nucleic acid-binding protein n=1 Tax=Prosthecobacter fusiformis TaxID=48464 RepID=A0A4R7RUJ4_9BACT|nr:DUF3368 domain-containing protein [Prosthecobacter fusiformis]TDU68107.1 hypothetical protein EI77_03224 [Prosthecobacter fusiformis]
MTVITDTSVVLNLCLIAQEQSLAVVFDEIHAPVTVKLEFERLASEDARFNGLSFPAFIQVHWPTSLWPDLVLDPPLDPGESDSMKLAAWLEADIILIDEAAGRLAAKKLGMKTMGLLGILLEGKSRGLIPSLKPLLNDLSLRGRFWISPALRSSVLKLAGEED